LWFRFVADRCRDQPAEAKSQSDEGFAKLRRALQLDPFIGLHATAKVA
jgi:hypothetical protein